MGEKPMPDGRIGQEPWQMPLAMLFMTGSVFCPLVGIMVVSHVRRKAYADQAAFWFKLAAVAPALAAIAFVGAVAVRVREGKYGEAVLALGVSALIAVLAMNIWKTDSVELEEEFGTVNRTDE